jgi:hypothetical protein
LGVKWVDPNTGRIVFRGALDQKTRIRTHPDDADPVSRKARNRVRKEIAAALRRIATDAPELHNHLSENISTNRGRWSYRGTIAWKSLK